MSINNKGKIYCSKSMVKAKDFEEIFQKGFSTIF